MYHLKIVEIRGIDFTVVVGIFYTGYTKKSCKFVAPARKKPKEVFHKKRLIIVDLNNILCDIQYVKRGNILKREEYVLAIEDLQYELPAMIVSDGRARKVVTARKNVLSFLQKVSEMAHVMIWTCMNEDNAVPIVAGRQLKPQLSCHSSIVLDCTMSNRTSFLQTRKSTVNNGIRN